jgi:hypothetical protein
MRKLRQNSSVLESKSAAPYSVKRPRASTFKITKEQVMPMLSEACPSYEAPSPKEQFLYLALGDFARHLLKLQRRRFTQDFPAVAKIVERLCIEGDPNVREAATIGLLEGIQSVWSSEGTDPELFGQYLLPESVKWWRRLREFWAGKSEMVGKIL